MSTNLRLQLSPAELERLAKGEKVTILTNSTACATPLDAKETGKVAGGLFEDYNDPPDFSDGGMYGGPSNFPFGIDSISVNIGVFSVSWDTKEIDCSKP